MADQQIKKTQSGPASGAGSPPSNAIPAAGQDRPKGGTSSAGGAGDSATGRQSTAGQNIGTQGTGAAGSTGSGTSQASTSSGINSSKDQPIGEQLSSTANGILDKAKETASGTYDAVASQATTKIEEHKGELSTGLRTLADTFRKTGTDLEGAAHSTALTEAAGRYTGLAARQIDNLAGYFERKDMRAMMRDAEGFARRNPAIFLGAAFALGMVAARFLKSSTPDRIGSINTGSLNANMPTALPSGSERPGSLGTNP